MLDGRNRSSSGGRARQSAFLTPQKVALAFFKFIFPPWTLLMLFQSVVNFVKLSRSPDFKKKAKGLLEGANAAAGFMQLLPVIVLIVTLAGVGPFVPFLALGAPAVIAIMFVSMLIARGLGAALFSALVINPSQSDQGKKVGLLRVFLFYGLLERSISDLAGYMKERAAKAQAQKAAASSVELPSIASRKVSASGSSATRYSAANVELRESRALEETPPTADVSATSDVDVSATSDDATITPSPIVTEAPAPVSASTSTRDLMRGLGGDKVSVFQRQLSVHELQLTQERKCNYLSYSPDRLQETQTRLENMRNSMLENKASMTLTDIRNMERLLPEIDKLLDRIERTKRIHEGAEKSGTSLSKLNEELDKISQSAKGLDTEGAGLAMDSKLQAFETELSKQDLVEPALPKEQSSLEAGSSMNRRP